MTTINNKHVLITGGASGIGRRLALRCAEIGAAVTIWDLDEAGAQAVAAEAAAARRPARCAPSPATSATASRSPRAPPRSSPPRAPVDILVNNAGVVSGKPLLELTDEHIERTFRVNTLALFWTTKAFLPAMVARGSGHIVTVASAAGLIGSPRETDYAASKFAAVGFNEALRLELKRSAPGVKTTVVRPFYIDTGHVRRREDALPAAAPDPQGGRRHGAHPAGHPARRAAGRSCRGWCARCRLMRLLPVWAFDGLADFFGITVAMDEFTGRETPEQRAEATRRRPAAAPAGRLEPELVPADGVAGAERVRLGVRRAVDAEHAAHRAAVERADDVGVLLGQLAVHAVVDLDDHDARRRRRRAVTP